MTLNPNPYAPPIAPVADVVPLEAVAAEPPFFAVSIPKLIIMSLCTFLVYEVYWFYRHWRSIEDRERSGMAPWGRALFAVFYCYQCFARIRDYDGTQHDGSMLSLTSAEAVDETPDVGSTLPAAPLAIGWIAFTLFARASRALAMITPAADSLGWLPFVALGFLIPVQIHANRINALVAPSHDRNSRIRGWNWLVVIPGTVLFLMAFVGTFLITNQP